MKKQIIATLTATTFVTITSSIGMSNSVTGANVCNYYAGKAVNGESIYIDMCSISRESDRTVNFSYYLAQQRIESQANCQSRTWTSLSDRTSHSPQSQATKNMLQIVCTAPSSNPGIVIGVVFDPPSYIRKSPNGKVICAIKELRAIELNGGITPDGWLFTPTCGGGVIHKSQIRFN
ncbi:hypothetical protein GTQ43_03590 [Nostoc sp. KVJ3]|uniref:hypothetical protein n=1 Tax=Nostoc sp. KVJ3 TaxID=457945 RepID=UPI0022372235|nr:hypothetical protein [Nostoc sp. KVJ3]MCW5312964.1 hypothetical protein [Nostoc sp. KVJ3]